MSRICKGGEDPSKIQQHLTLLREQYVKLQEKCLSLEKKLALTSVSEPNQNDTFVGRLLIFIASLYGKEEYSDLVITLSNQTVKSHKFVLNARGSHWGTKSLEDVQSLDWTDLGDCGETLLRWAYTDYILLDDDKLALDILRAAAKFKLHSLVERCEETLIGSVNVRNCVQLYSTAEEIGAESLKKHCSSLISTHWNDFTSEDFAHMSAQLLYEMFKSKTEFWLHAAVRLEREDVLFLYLIDFNSQLPSVLDRPDDEDRLALDLALENQNESIAKTLLKHKASVDAVNTRGVSVIHSACQRGDHFAITFLLDNDCRLNTQEPQSLRYPLHIVASQRYTDEAKMANIAQRMIEEGASINAQDKDLRTPLHLAVLSSKEEIVGILLEKTSIELDIRDTQEKTALWYALDCGDQFDGNSFAAKLIEKGASMDLKFKSGESMLHLLIKEKRDTAAVYMVASGASTNVLNSRGENPLHLSCTLGYPELTSTLIQHGADMNCRTSPATPSHHNGSLDPFNDDDDHLYRETPLHRAVRHGNMEDLCVMLNFIDASSPKNSKPILDVEDSEGMTPLACALLSNQLEIAQKLQEKGANVNHLSPEGLSLLHRSIMQKNSKMSLFLLSRHADPNVRTQEGASPLQLCIVNSLPEVVECLCKNKANMSSTSFSWPEPPLWLALDKTEMDIASILVSNGVDVDGWAEGFSGCEQTMLHRAIDDNREDIACFLIRSGCDVDALPRVGPSGKGSDVASEAQTPLHMCCEWGLFETAQELISFGAKINAKNGEGKTSFHIALENGHQELIGLLLDHPELDFSVKDSKGRSAFAVAMTTKNNKAAQAILEKYPPAAEQVDTRGQTFLHIAIQKGDLESVLFLLGVHVNLTCRTQDDRAYTPLHLATSNGDEMIVRNLLLAGADITELTPQKETCLHVAVREDHAHLVPIFIENGINVDSLDTNLNNALHVSIKEGHLSCVKSLLTESQINAGAVNLRGQNPLHLLACYPKENAAAIGQLFLEALPEYPINTTDVEGNTALLSAYTRGAGQLCRVLVRAGACLGTSNKQGINIFNYEVATKALLGRLLDCISVEPPWSDGDFCLECGCKFGLATRKHHCRHCGRLLCNKCSSRDVPIIKFHINKPVRVCQLCFDVITMGPTALS